MEIQLHQKMRDKVEGKLKQEGQQAKQQPAEPPPPPLSKKASSPPSASSSPSHEFSFTISLQPTAAAAAAAVPDKAAKVPPPLAIDLSPADEIFFHGHLLPLHLLPHLPVSPRTSINSLDSFTLPIRELLEDQNPNKSTSELISTVSSNNSYDNHCESKDFDETRERTKSKSFSLFGLPKWRKECELREKEADKEKQKRRLKFDMSHVLKRYMRMIRPLLSFRGRRGNMQFERQSYSFSGSTSLSLRGGGRRELRGGRGDFSAPASMRTSPTNSGLLVATGARPSPTSDSTMEELQAAIQAAIAHCKNSIAMEEKIKCQD